MYTIELTTRLNPTSISIQRKDFIDAEKVYQQICQAMETGNSRMINLMCEGSDKKQICVLTSEILAVQIYQAFYKQHESIYIKETERRRAGFRV